MTNSEKNCAYDPIRCREVWKRVCPGEDVYPAPTALPAEEEELALPGAQQDPCCMGSDAVGTIEVLQGFLREELGDVLMQVLFNIHMEEEAGRFTTDDVTDHVVRKLIFRHPHVFSNTRADDSEQVLINWDKLKRQEKGQRTTAEAMDSVARSLPALWRADKLQSKAAKAGFEFAGVSGALDKLDEETQELRAAVESGTNFEEELGDVLFAAVKVGRFCGGDPEAALEKTCEKFIARFRKVEEAASERGEELSSLPLDTLTALWNEAKQAQ